MPGIDNFFGLGLRELRDWLTVLRTREMQGNPGRGREVLGNAGRERERQGNGWQGNEDLRRGDG
jgi:hypothetical protein